MKKASPMLLVLLTALGLTLTLTLPKQSRTSLAATAGAQEVKTHPAQKKDFLSESGQTVLEVVEASYQTTPDSFDSSSVLAKNLSGKNITALGLVWTVNYEDKTSCQIEQLVDYRPHRDIVADRNIRPFAPGEDKVIPRLTKDTLEEGRGIESVKVEFAFTELGGRVPSAPTRPDSTNSSSTSVRGRKSTNAGWRANTMTPRRSSKPSSGSSRATSCPPTRRWKTTRQCRGHWSTSSGCSASSKTRERQLSRNSSAEAGSPQSKSEPESPLDFLLSEGGRR